MIRNYVHSSIDNTKIATWDSGKIKYGDNNGLSPWTCIDIIGHEFGHGVDQTSSVLSGDYAYEPAALREGLSDIWGAMVKYYAKPDDARIYINAGDVSINGIRNLSNPKLRDMPDTYEGEFWTHPSGFLPAHRKSNVFSHWFYILAEGKTVTNDNGHSYDVQGIGKEKAAEIVYRAETVYFESFTDYALARIAMVRSANDLFQAGSDEAKAVCKAWYAVGVGRNECFTRIVTGGGFGNGNDPTNQPTEVDVICDRGSKTYSLLFVNSTSTVSWIVSPNLEKVNETTLSVTVRGRRNATLGHAYVIATVNGVAYRQDIWIGEPQVSMRYEQQIPYQVYVHIEGTNGTDITKQGITNIDWQLVNPTGNCTATLDIFSPNVYLALVQANCYNWAAQMQVGVTNPCGIIPLTRNVTSDGYLGGGGGYCYTIIYYFGLPHIVPCGRGGLNPFGRQENQVQKFDIYNYMGVHSD